MCVSYQDLPHAGTRRFKNAKGKSYHCDGLVNTGGNERELELT